MEATSQKSNSDRELRLRVVELPPPAMELWWRWDNVVRLYAFLQGKLRLS